MVTKKDVQILSRIYERRSNLDLFCFYLRGCVLNENWKSLPMDYVIEEKFVNGYNELKKGLKEALLDDIEYRKLLRQNGYIKKRFI